MKLAARPGETAPVEKSKRKKRSAKSPPSGGTSSGQAEDRTVVAVTVVWMLTLVCSLAAELVLLVCLALARLLGAPSDAPSLAQVTAGALLLAALVTGVFCLALTPLVWRMRHIKPPLAIVAAAVLVGLAPLVTLVVLSRLT
jgi:hypothetical protein